MSTDLGTVPTDLLACRRELRSHEGFPSISMTVDGRARPAARRRAVDRMVADARDRLAGAIDGAELDAISHRLRELADGAPRIDAGASAVFVGPTVERVVALPAAVDDGLRIGRRFATRDLIDVDQRAIRHWVIVDGDRRTEVMAGRGAELREHLTVPRFTDVDALDEILIGLDGDDPVVLVSERPDARALVRHGHRRHQVAAVVAPPVGDGASVAAVVAPVLDDLIARERRATLHELEVARRHGHLAVGLREVWRAVHRQEVTLLAADSQYAPGAWITGDELGAVAQDPTSERVDDAVDLAAEVAITAGTRVELVPGGLLHDAVKTLVAAITTTPVDR